MVFIGSMSIVWGFVLSPAIFAGNPLAQILSGIPFGMLLGMLAFHLFPPDDY